MQSKTSQKLLEAGILLTCTLFPIKLTLGYIGLIPLLVGWTFYKRNVLWDLFKELPTSFKYLFSLLVTFALTGIFGINPWNSFVHIGTLFFFPLTILCFFDLFKTYEAFIIRCFLGGTVIACALQMFSLYSGNELPIIGAVSQSGQLAMSLFLALYWVEKKPSDKYFSFISFALICITLILNLKRGPWFGVVTMLCLYLVDKKPRVAILFLLMLAIAVSTVAPIQERLASSVNHFFISGGRSEIWRIGSEFTAKYPLGIGFDNSGVLRDFSLEIPKNLKHFHSNFLNILVEGGWFSFFLYLSFLFYLAKETLVLFYNKSTSTQLSSLIGIGLFASVLAGLVEYNFGDSAVITVFYIMLGFFYRKLIDEVPSTASSFQYQNQS